MRFLGVVRTISAAARERNEIGQGGDVVWSLDEWRRFCDAGSAYVATGGLYSRGLGLQIKRIETMLGDGKDAGFVHRTEYWFARRAASDGEAERESKRQEEVRAQRRERESRISEEMDREMVRLEARERARAVFNARPEESRGNRRRRTAAEEPHELEFR